MASDTPSAAQDRLLRLLTFLNHDPRNLPLLIDALTLAISVGDHACHQRLIEHITTHQIEDPDACAHATHLLLQVGQYADAATFGDKAIAGGIEHPAVLFNTALGHFYSGDYAAANTYLSLLTGNPQCPPSSLMMHARALYQLEQTEEAQALVARALEQEPGNAEIRGLLALLLYENDDNTQALSAAHETLAQDPDQLEALLACATVQFEQNNISASRKAWLHTVQKHPDCGRAWSGLAQLEFNELEFEQAEESLKKAAHYMPDHIGTWHLLAWIYILRKDSAKARQALDKSYALDRSFGETHGGLAVVDVMDGRQEQAREGIRRALKLNPTGLSAHYAQALLLQEAGRSDEAAQLLDRVVNQTRPGSEDTGRSLIENWLKTHDNNASRTRSRQH
ncbi:tetratricopeptide repeat protein [Pseudomonas gingeri]|uniref:Tetratricopeptide repeat protein n=1 Tax=Pseudomonas gingeri TaxID=117681 RepID=A0A7Y7X9F5_9PSED|nr:tetratricopeptide repeat protein [Pseudomonas gingeri]NWB95768.1 tetratricopeptide repeat protein [Pseudomonas gingeri]